MDADEDSVAVVTRSCDGVQLRVLALAGPVVRYRGPSSCRLRLAESARRTRAGLLHVRTSCRGFSRDCVASELRVTPLGHTHPILARGEETAGDGNSFDLRLTDAGRRLLRNRSSVRASLSAKIVDEALVGDRRSRTLTLPARKVVRRT
jgi:hypothetical protein